MSDNDTNQIDRIGLALSGGGVRAAAFHAGVLKWLAERELLEKVQHISSVSGGTLFTGLTLHASGYNWPSSVEYLNETYPQIRAILTGKSLQLNAILRLLLWPLNWRFILSRANVVSQSIKGHWGISAKLSQLPNNPVWSINGTTAENGRRFRFKGVKIGDYESGYADARDFSLSDAMAVSAAFPCGIGPLVLRTRRFSWYKRDKWDSSQPAELVTPPYNKLHLYDGGVYDNLGLEPLFDIGKQEIKTIGDPGIDFLIVSDAGAAFSRMAIPGPLHPGRLKRIADAASDQVRALRVRCLVNFLKNYPAAGMYLQIGSDPVSSLKRYCESMSELLKEPSRWLDVKEVSSAAKYKTTLMKMKKRDFDLVARHGYETACWNEISFFKEM